MISSLNTSGDIYDLIEAQSKTFKYLNQNFRDIFYSSAKKNMESYRSSLRIISLIKNSNAGKEFSVSVISYVASRVFEICSRTISTSYILLDNLKQLSLNDKTISKNEEIEARIFYHKMIADFLRYKIEVLFLLKEHFRICDIEERELTKKILKDFEFADKLFSEEEILNKDIDDSIFNSIKESKLNYEKAIENGNENLEFLSHNFLGAILNYSVFLFEIEKKENEAISFASDYFNYGMGKLFEVKSKIESEKCNMILLLMKDNIEGWKEDKKENNRKTIL